MPDIYGLTAEQFAAVGGLVERSKVVRRPPGVVSQRGPFPGSCRVIAVASRVYDPTTFSTLPAFEFDPSRNVWVVEFTGSALQGYIVLTINGRALVLECRRQNLDDVVRVVPELVRAVVLPGLWEFEFAESAEVDITWRNITTQEDLTLCELFDDVASVVFIGAATVYREAWATTDDELGLSTVDVVDAIPFTTGTVSDGAIGLASYHWGCGWVVFAWQCRSFSFADGYAQADDPVPL